MEILNNRYTKLTLLTLGIGTLLWVIFWLILMSLGINDFPVALQMAAAYLGASLLVYKYLANRIF